MKNLRQEKIKKIVLASVEAGGDGLDLYEVLHNAEVIEQNPEIPEVHLIYLSSMVLATNRVKEEIRLRIKCN
jgi:hypothetical protein